MILYDYVVDKSFGFISVCYFAVCIFNNKNEIQPINYTRNLKGSIAFI